MYRYAQLHLLTAYPPSNLNRDDLGRPKSAVMGGSNRLRIASQALKRAWRTSDLFQEALAGHIGTRTKEMGRTTFDQLVEKGMDTKKSWKTARTIAKQFGKIKGKEKDDDAWKEAEKAEDPDKEKQRLLEIEQLAHFDPTEIEAIKSLTNKLASEDRMPEEDELGLLREKTTAVDVALFGRMLAASTRYNIDGSTQVSHAVTVHPVAVEDDFFTAVDDLNRSEEDMGAGHMGETEFGAGLYYLYICIDRELLRKNLDDDALAQRAIRGLVEASALVSPTGKQNSFASRVRASYILCETGDQQPRNLAVAFLEGIKDRDLLKKSIKRLEETREKIDKVYGACSSADAILNAYTGEGSLEEVLTCASS